MEVSRIARKPIEVDVAATLPSGEEAALEATRFTLCDHSGPTAGSVYVAGRYTPAVGEAQAFFTVIVCGPDAEDQSDALVLTAARPELWAVPTQTGVVASGYIDTLYLT